MTRTAKMSIIMLLTMAASSFAASYVDLYGGRDSEGRKKYIRWPASDSNKISYEYAPSDEVTKIMYSCLVQYDATDWDVSEVVSVAYDDEVDEALIKVKLQYIFSKRFLRATVTKGGYVTCHGIKTD